MSAWASPSAGYSDPRYERLAAELEAFLGVPYVWGGEGQSGADCSGSLWYVCRRAGFHYPRTTARKMWAVWGGTEKSNWRDGEFGDLVWFTFSAHRPFGHVGMIKAGNEFYNASSRRGFVLGRFTPGNTYDRHFAGIKSLE
ncbi:MAG: NlpC/P60 family protein [Candidatus Alcyoniella australis]|nr:NlpC/P60 family protein [Candidatus Alcyoniella australis]